MAEKGSADNDLIPMVSRGEGIFGGRAHWPTIAPPHFALVTAYK